MAAPFTPAPPLTALLDSPNDYAQTVDGLAALIRQSLAEEAPPTEATPANDWAAQADGELLRLPGSGKWARLRKVPMMAMIAFAGKSPNVLADEVLRFNAVSTNGSRQSPQEQIAQYKANVQAFIRMAAMCFVAPKLVLEGEPDRAANEIGPFDVVDIDYRWIYFTFLQGEDAELAPFRRPAPRDAA